MTLQHIGFWFSIRVENIADREAFDRWHRNSYNKKEEELKNMYYQGKMAAIEATVGKISDFLEAYF